MNTDFRNSLSMPMVLLMPILAQAGATSTTFQVQATVITSCQVSGTTLNFSRRSDVVARSTPLDATSTLRVLCTNTTPYTVALSVGTNASGASDFSTRVMKNGAQTISYQLYLDAARSSVWGDGTSSSSVSTGTGTGIAQTLTLYGRLPSLNNVAAGSYTDTVSATVSY